jgi:hypothetical protein
LAVTKSGSMYFDAATSLGLVMAGNSKERDKKLERLLSESVPLRETAEKLAAEVARLREEIERDQRERKERRKGK